MKALFCDLYNFSITGDTACNMNANSNMSANHAGPTLLILNDKAQDNVHFPLIRKLAAFMGGQGAKARSIAYYDDGTSPTLRSVPSGTNMVPDICIDIADDAEKCNEEEHSDE